MEVQFTYKKVFLFMCSDLNYGNILSHNQDPEHTPLVLPFPGNRGKGGMRDAAHAPRLSFSMAPLGGSRTAGPERSFSNFHVNIAGCLCLWGLIVHGACLRCPSNFHQQLKIPQWLGTFLLLSTLSAAITLLLRYKMHEKHTTNIQVRAQATERHLIKIQRPT